jgi:RNA polymerase sigma factor for flagellar operon FliA
MDIEERKLWELYKRTGRSDLQEKIVMKYLNLVHYLSHRLVSFSTPSLDRDDLYSAGVIGLLEAIERFDLEKEVEFKSYATLRIKGAIIDEIRRFDWVPRSVRKKSKQLDATVHRLFSQLNRMPTDEEIAEELEISVDEYYQLTDSIGPLFVMSLDSTIDGDRGDMHFADMMSDNYDADIESNKEKLKVALAEGISSLPEKERLVISLYYYENLNLKEIGAVLGVSESRVSQIHSSAIGKLRSVMTKKLDRV